MKMLKKHKLSSHSEEAKSSKTPSSCMICPRGLPDLISLPLLPPPPISPPCSFGCTTLVFSLLLTLGCSCIKAFAFALAVPWPGKVFPQTHLPGPLTSSGLCSKAASLGRRSLISSLLNSSHPCPFASWPGPVLLCYVRVLTASLG